MITPAPFMIRVLVTPTDPMEEQRPSGLVIPYEETCEFHRPKSGVIEAIGAGVQDDSDFEGLEVGVVLYYIASYKVGPIEFVPAEFKNLIGWEE